MRFAIWVFLLLVVFPLDALQITPNVAFIMRRMQFFAKVGRFASEEVLLELILKKSLPILTYGLEVCAFPIRVLQSLDFTVNRVLMKLLKSSNTAVIEQCRYFFHIELPSVQLQRRFEKFLANAANDDNVY